jgi:hypothetical protein
MLPEGIKARFPVSPTATIEENRSIKVAAEIEISGAHLRVKLVSSLPSALRAVPPLILRVHGGSRLFLGQPLRTLCPPKKASQHSTLSSNLIWLVFVSRPLARHIETRQCRQIRTRQEYVYEAYNSFVHGSFRAYTSYRLCRGRPKQ